MLCMRRTSGFLAMVFDFFKYFFHSKVTDKASHPSPVGFRRTLGRNSPSWNAEVENCWLLKDTNYWCLWWKVLLVHLWDLVDNDLFLQGLISKKIHVTLLLTPELWREKSHYWKFGKKPSRAASVLWPSPLWKCPQGFVGLWAHEAAEQLCLVSPQVSNFSKKSSKNCFLCPHWRAPNLGVKFPGVRWNQQHREGFFGSALSFRCCFLLYFYLH